MTSNRIPKAIAAALAVCLLGAVGCAQTNPASTGNGNGNVNASSASQPPADGNRNSEPDEAGRPDKTEGENAAADKAKGYAEDKKLSANVADVTISADNPENEQQITVSYLWEDKAKADDVPDGQTLSRYSREVAEQLLAQNPEAKNITVTWFVMATKGHGESVFIVQDGKLENVFESWKL